MQYVDEFRDPKYARLIIERINQTLEAIPESRKPLQVMEVCGGHTHTIFKFGIDQLLPDSIEFVHGPGCPVCVLPKSRLDECIAIAENPQVIFCTFGDAIRVPGSSGSLQDARARGADVRIVYSPLDALALAQQNPDREVVFFGLGFETTMPSTAMTLKQAKLNKIDNFSLFCQHITIIPTLQCLLEPGDLRLDGFLMPGHVSMIIGSEPYQFIANQYGKPSVITGFEPLDILQALLMLVEQIAEQRCEVENQYKRIVQPQGNQQALIAMQEVFEAQQRSEWRGLGDIENSGIQLNKEYQAFDAEVKFCPEKSTAKDPAECRCGEVLTGRCKPTDCSIFATSCRPDNAIGALMVSSEGACAAYYQYRREEHQ